MQVPILQSDMKRDVDRRRLTLSGRCREASNLEILQGFNCQMDRHPRGDILSVTKVKKSIDLLGYQNSLK
jgi:hypothetical protein